MSASSRHIVEKFVHTVATHLGDECVAVSFLPWTADSKYCVDAHQALVPKSGSDKLDEHEVKRFMKSKTNVVCACTFDDVSEEAAADRILAQFANFPTCCVLIVHLLPANVTPSRDNLETLMQRHEKMVATGVDDVLMNPDVDDPEALCALLRKSWLACELNARRMQMMLDSSTEVVSEEDLDALQEQHRHLLWDSIPRALMPQLSPINKSILETDTCIGQYTFGERLPTVQGNVIQAVDASKGSRPVVLKVIEKSQIFTPGELEGIYRELRFLTEVLRHPNVTHCVDFLHTHDFLYMVFEFVGKHNLGTFLNELPGKRLRDSRISECIGQAMLCVEPDKRASMSNVAAMLADYF
mmetsp:Transcript_146538/g.255679  ORF Transcript_146538/g.255679 Transcript_146538/m.255679 type:complete len:355 (+) Transcript_146538:63-1127(+)